MAELDPLPIKYIFRDSAFKDDIALKDIEKCIQLIKEVLKEAQKPWNMVVSPLYYRYTDTVQGKSFSGVGNNFVRALAAEIENKEEYEFLRGNKELEAIFEEYLK